MQIFPERPFQSLFIRARAFMALPRGMPGLLPAVLLSFSSVWLILTKFLTMDLGFTVKWVIKTERIKSLQANSAQLWSCYFYSQMAFSLVSGKKNIGEVGLSESVKDPKMNKSLWVRPCPKPQLSVGEKGRYLLSIRKVTVNLWSWIFRVTC